jgi:hypothetical protein
MDFTIQLINLITDWDTTTYNLLIGLVSGGLSGFIVSHYFVKSQERREWLKAFQNDKQNLNKFIYSIQIEIDMLIYHLKNEKIIDVKDVWAIKRLFANHPLTPTFKDSLTEDSLDNLVKARTFIDQIESTISSDFSLNELIRLRSELVKSRMLILSLKQKKYLPKKYHMFQKTS